MAPWCPQFPYTPYKSLYPCWPLSTYTPCQSPMHPWHSLHLLTAPWCSLLPYTPYQPPMPPDAPIPLLVLKAYTSCQPPIHLYQPLDTPLTPPTSLPVQASSGQQWYYCRSAWHATENFYTQKTFYLQGWLSSYCFQGLRLPKNCHLYWQLYPVSDWWLTGRRIYLFYFYVGGIGYNCWTLSVHCI